MYIYHEESTPPGVVLCYSVPKVREMRICAVFVLICLSVFTLSLLLEKKTEVTFHAPYFVHKFPDIKRLGPPTYIIMSSAGRLGNQMREYTALLAVTRKYRSWTPFTRGFKQLRRTFGTTLSIDTLPSDLKLNNVTVISCDNNKLTRQLESNNHSNVSLSGYCASPVYFSSIQKEIKKEFTFSDTVQQKVMQLFTLNIPGEWKGHHVTRVGIHVRRGDLMKKRYYKEIPDTYFSRAMEYFQEHFPRVQFFLATDDSAWCKSHINGSHVVYIKKTYDVDLAALTMCDHVITSQGSFSLWAGRLCSGITLYPSSVPKSCETNYRNKTWIPIEADRHI